MTIRMGGVAAMTWAMAAARASPDARHGVER